METKHLKIEGVGGKIENQYNLCLDVPSIQDLLPLIEKPPFQICSKQATTFSSGILSQIPHAVKIRISRDYQEPFIGVFIEMTPKQDELVEIRAVEGHFVCPIPTENSSNGSSPESRNSSSAIVHSQNMNNSLLRLHSTLLHVQNNLHNNQRHEQLHENFGPNYNNNTIGNENSLDQRKKPCCFNINFFKTTAKTPIDLSLDQTGHLNYYETRCHNWPSVGTKLCITITVLKTNYSVIVNDEIPFPSAEPVQSTFESERFFLSKACSDVTIKVGSTSFPAHKIILSARSKYFCNMFSTNMREALEGVVNMDEDESLLKEILSFIYLGKVENIENNARDLFLLADKYDIEDLAIYCERYLLERLCIDNAIEMYDLTHTVGKQGILARKSKQLIMWNKEKFVTDLETFKTFSMKYPDLIFELLKL